MVALPLFDVILSAKDGPDRSQLVASELVQSALDEIRHIEKVDESLAPGESSKFDRQTVALVRGMYEDWSRAADALLDRVTRLERHSRAIPGAESLRDAQGRVRAMLSVSLDRLEEDHLDADGIRGIPIEEVRSELRLGVR
jgi:hypothetical protein